MVYPIASELLRELIPRASLETPALVELHRLTLVSVWPDAIRYMAVSAELAEWMQISREGNHRSWTLRLAHGLTDFLNSYASRQVSPLVLRLMDPRHGDELDREFLQVLERRADRAKLSISFINDRAPEPDGSASDTPEMLLSQSRRYMHLGYYAAALEIAQRVVDRVPAGATRTGLRRNILFALLLLGRFSEVEAACEENLAHADDYTLLAHTAYARAILIARFYEPARRDFEAARRWVHEALRYTALQPFSETSVVNLAFFRNTLALIEMRTGNLAGAHDLLASGLELIARDAPARYQAECVLLLHNRARLHLAEKNPRRALEDLTELLVNQPGNPEAHLDRGLLHQRAGRYEEALRDYDEAIRWSPPWPEPYLNRAQIYTALGRPQAALADYDYVLSLVPDHVEALNDRACVLFGLSRYDAARTDADAGLRLKPGHARLLCLRGLLEMKRDDLLSACRSFSASIEADPALADAWANRGAARMKMGDPERAIADLKRALELREDPGIRSNLDVVYRLAAVRRESRSSAAD